MPIAEQHVALTRGLIDGARRLTASQVALGFAIGVAFQAGSKPINFMAAAKGGFAFQ